MCRCCKGPDIHRARKEAGLLAIQDDDYHLTWQGRLHNKPLKLGRTRNMPAPVDDEFLMQAIHEDDDTPQHTPHSPVTSQAEQDETGALEAGGADNVVERTEEAAPAPASVNFMIDKALAAYVKKKEEQQQMSGWVFLSRQQSIASKAHSVVSVSMSDADSEFIVI